jgi:hypothetical protein
VFGALLFAGQAGHVHGGVAQRHKWLALTWHGNRFEKFSISRHNATPQQKRSLAYVVSGVDCATTC